MPAMGGIEGTAQKADAKTIGHRAWWNDPAQARTIK
jgi:hypothetical protein